jgi:hypothetical protein
VPELSDRILAAIQRPRAVWNLVEIYELPIADICTGHAKIIPDHWTDI